MPRAEQYQWYGPVARKTKQWKTAWQASKFNSLVTRRCFMLFLWFCQHCRSQKKFFPKAFAILQMSEDLPSGSIFSKALLNPFWNYWLPLDLFTNCTVFCSKLHLFLSQWEWNSKTKQPITRRNHITLTWRWHVFKMRCKHISGFAF